MHNQKAEVHSLSYYLFVTRRRRREVFMPFSWVWGKSEIQTALSRIRTSTADSISKNDDDFARHPSLQTEDCIVHFSGEKWNFKEHFWMISFFFFFFFWREGVFVITLWNSSFDKNLTFTTSFRAFRILRLTVVGIYVYIYIYEVFFRFKKKYVLSSNDMWHCVNKYIQIKH